MQENNFTIDRGEALMRFFEEYRLQGDKLPVRMHDHKEPIIELISAGISAASAFAIVVGDGIKAEL